MSRAYKIHNKEGIYFISFATVGWIDVFTKKEYKDIVVESLSYCQKAKGLTVYAWCIMHKSYPLDHQCQGEKLTSHRLVRAA